MADITPQTLIDAYSVGIFPMAESAEDDALYWIDPEIRGILPLESFHTPKRLARTIRSGKFEIRIDSSFKDVIEACASTGNARDTTWINRRIRNLYTDLFELGYCHCVETWLDGKLVGGLYGLRLGGAFFGESMFSTTTDASKVALVYLVARLKYGGFTLLDTQFVTDHLQQFGAIEMPQAEYKKTLKKALEYSGDFQRLDQRALPADILQSVSQTS